MSDFPEAFPLHATHRLDGRSGSTSAARGLTAAFLRGPPMNASRALETDALLLVSELVSNAVRHAPGPCVLELVDDGSDLVIAVSDTSDSLPQQRRPDRAAGGGGFGWSLLTALSGPVTVIRSLRRFLLGAALPPAGDTSVQMGLAHRTSVRGRRRMSYFDMSSQRCSAFGWLELWVSIAVHQ